MRKIKIVKFYCKFYCILLHLLLPTSPVVDYDGIMMVGSVFQIIGSDWNEYILTENHSLKTRCHSRFDFLEEKESIST